MRRDNSGGFTDLLIQAKITNRLLASGLRSQMTQQKLIALLASTEATAKEIAEILDTTPGTVSTTLQRLKKRGEKSVKSNDSL